MNDRVLVTGGGGFVGTHLAARQLELGRHVTILDTNVSRLTGIMGNPNLTILEGDVRNGSKLREALHGIDTVFHLASAHLEVSKSYSYFWETNVEASRTLALESARTGVRRFVHCSSVGVYGPLKCVPADESTPCHPDIAYEATKLEGEQAVLDVADSVDLSTVVLRPSWIYGPGCPRTEKLFSALRRRRFVVVGNGKNLRHPVYIDDVLQAFELAATRSSVSGQIFVIASAEYVELNKLIDTILEIENSDFRPRKVPLAIMQPVCRIAEILARLGAREPPFSRRSLKFFTEDSAFSIAKAKRNLGYAPQFDLLTGLTRMREALFDTSSA